jgi:hypothetical protein
MKRSRRTFLRLLAVGSAAAATSATPLARAVTPKRRPTAAREPKPAPAATVPAAFAEEIRKQKELVEQALKAVREVRLPPGSDPAFVFAPLTARGKRSQP